MSSAASRPPKSASHSTEAPAQSQPEHQSGGSSEAVGSEVSTAEALNSTATDVSTNAGNGAGTDIKAKKSAKEGLKKPVSRSLLKPPARPKPPAAPKPSAAAAPPPKPEPEAPPEPQRPGPISLPSEPMQYRAIGLLKGKFMPSEEQFNRGNIAAADGTLIDAVLLGRVTSLIKKHIDLEQDHLWVVYPRTLYKDEEGDGEGESESKVPALHVQIVGVWEPETLNPEAMATEDEDARPLSSTEAEEQCDCFSVRGEVAKYSEDQSEIVINIVQKSKSETAKPKRPFKILIKGQLAGRTVGYFWELVVERVEGSLILKEGKPIAVVPPKKKPKGKKLGKRRPFGGKPRSGGAPKPKPKPKSAESKSVEAKPAEDKTAEAADVQAKAAQPKTANVTTKEVAPTETAPAETAPQAATATTEVPEVSAETPEAVTESVE